jgi:stearoyl-CoA desaturase (delta-9 desaturase)
MLEFILNFLNQGVLHASWVTKLVYFFVVTQLTILSVTLYLHRSQAHRGVDFNPILAHVFRLWSWLSTGMVTKEWVAIHRKHHAKCETEEDPHSPQVYGINKVLWEGVDLYRMHRPTPRRSRSTAAARRTTGSSVICMPRIRMPARR